MKTRCCLRLIFLLAALVLTLNGCAMQKQWREAAQGTVREQDLGGLPYHPLVYNLDLSILAYQLYGQSLVWPHDPYYEEADNGRGERARLIERVRGWAKTQGGEQVKRGAGLGSYRGPGELGGFDDNPGHDPILYRYDRLHPWSHAITNVAGRWTEYLTPEEITGQVREVYVAYRKTGEEEGEVAIARLAPGRADHARGARDVILVFEGGTGDKGEPGRPASQSLMGFVLVRHLPGGRNYDVHIAFRGSRSGSAGRAVRQSLSDRKASGNPDWITDLGYNPLDPERGGGHITTTGKVSRGFAHSMDSILPQLMRCLRKVAELERGGRPERIYVTGHSLGAALAQHFVSAVLLGDRYGPGGSGAEMAAALRGWPWKQMKLVTFAAPRAGDSVWARTLTVEGLDTEVFSTLIDPYDRKALPVAHPSIVPRLIDRDRPAGFRVLIPTDPVTTQKVIGGKHVGKSVYLDSPRLLDAISPPDTGAHEPENIRELMLESLGDQRIPPNAYRYREMTDLNPTREEPQRGSAEEYGKLKVAIERYYRDKGMWLDHAGFARDFDRFMKLRQTD